MKRLTPSEAKVFWSIFLLVLGATGIIYLYQKYRTQPPNKKRLPFHLFLKKWVFDFLKDLLK